MSTMLEKMLRREDLARLFSETAEIMGGEATVLDAQARPIFGSPEPPDASHGWHPVVLDGETIGTVLAGAGSKPLAEILSYAARRERERKSLSQDCLGRMNEITLLNELSGKLCNGSEPKELSRLVMEAARRLVGADHVAVYVRENMAGPGSVTFATNSETSQKLQNGLSPIVDSVLSSGKADIVNDLASDPRFGSGSGGCLACVPLTRGGAVLGVLILLGATSREYSSQDMSQLATLANMFTLAMEGALTRQRLNAMAPTIKQAAATLQRLAADIPSGR